ncbi:MAG: hypothetical protein ACRDJC_04830 [Thermomicrobiales bacterium]
MFPTHPDTVCIISALDYQERLRAAAKARIAASAQAGERSPLTMSGTASRCAASWLSGMLLRLPSAKRAELADPAAQRHFELPSAGKA